MAPAITERKVLDQPVTTNAKLATAARQLSKSAIEVAEEYKKLNATKNKIAGHYNRGRRELSPKFYC